MRNIVFLLSNTLSLLTIQLVAQSITECIDKTYQLESPVSMEDWTLQKIDKYRLMLFACDSYGCPIIVNGEKHIDIDCDGDKDDEFNWVRPQKDSDGFVMCSNDNEDCLIIFPKRDIGNKWWLQWRIDGNLIREGPLSDIACDRLSH